MFCKKYAFYTIGIVCCLLISTKAGEPGSITKLSVSLDLIVENVKSLYHIGLISFTYDPNDLKMEQNGDSSSVKLLITKARLLILQGKTRLPPRPRYDIGPKGVLLLLETTGTANLSTDGNRIENCQFLFSEKEELKVSQVDKVVKDEVFKALPYCMAQELCDDINEYHSNKINSLD